MNNVSEGRMEQVILGTVSVVIVCCATLLGFYQRLDASTVLTSVATGIFGYAGMAQKTVNSNNTIVKKDEKESETQE